MIFEKTKIEGVMVASSTPQLDSRGNFTRLFCADEMQTQYIEFDVTQANLSHSIKKGTIRGLHLQKQPYQEKKFVGCLSGKIFDVAVDMRPDSETYLEHVAVELSSRNLKRLIVPEGCAHGFQTLEDNTSVIYFVSAAYHPASEKGYRFDDPTIGIDWPLKVKEISEKDGAWVYLKDQKQKGTN